MNIKYEFFFEEGRTEAFDLKFKPDTLSLEDFPCEISEPWVKLEFCKCEVCELDSQEHQNCPVAQNLAGLLLRFKDDFSYAKVTTRVTTLDRVTEKKGSLEQGVSAIMGLIMATSGCPILDCFKPMAFTHLPFSNENETILRAVSTYLTAQYIRMAKGKTADWDLKNLGALYEKVTQLNSAFSNRVRELKGKDANVNAVIALDLFAQVGSFSLPNNWIDQMETFFSAYLND